MMLMMKMEPIVLLRKVTSRKKKEVQFIELFS